jgi:endonuclease-3
LSLRLGMTREFDPDKIEQDLQKLRPPEDWTPFSMRLILHGRQICLARDPHCQTCALSADCPRIGVNRG